ncbi:hypothetical protein [Nocardia amamiensis]|uniref:hypothetical protein n=1 Tax=Nocardia amamiensis TaxID=404578 RepID=UPI001E5E40C1|nr:hypothetical protein [Nocardia amamiensis]
MRRRGLCTVVLDVGLSTTALGLGYLGLEWQRSLSSVSLRGAGRDTGIVDRDRRRVRPTRGGFV